MSVQRYDVTLNHADSDDPEAAMTRHSFGAYVKHQDYAALEAKCASLQAQLDASEAWINQLNLQLGYC